MVGEGARYTREKTRHCRANDEVGINADRKGKHHDNGVHYRGDTIFGGGEDQSMGTAVSVGTSVVVQRIGYY